MAIEKINKDKSIIQLIDHLEKKFGSDQLVINDFWDADLCAIGLSDQKKEALIYISTFDKKEGQYCISIEDINDPRISNIKSEKAEIKELEVIIAKYLKLEITKAQQKL